MIRSFFRVFALLVVFGGITACGPHRQPNVYPTASPPVEPSRDLGFGPKVEPILDCWLPPTRGDFGDWYISMSALPSMISVVDKTTGAAVCVGVLKPHDRMMGPAIWAHKVPGHEWAVVAVFYVTQTDSTRMEGVVDQRPAILDYIDQDEARAKNITSGWYFWCSCNR